MTRTDNMKCERCEMNELLTSFSIGSPDQSGKRKQDDDLCAQTLWRRAIEHQDGNTVNGVGRLHTRSHPTSLLQFICNLAAKQTRYVARKVQVKFDVVHSNDS